MTPTPDSLQSPREPGLAHSAVPGGALGLNTTYVWTVKEKDPATGLYIPKMTKKNVQTNYGITAYAGAFQGSYNAPTYMVIDGFAPTLVSLAGTTLVLTASALPTLGYDTQLVLSLGTGNQETVSFTNVSQNGSQYTYTLASTPVNSHSLNDICVRVPNAIDTMSAVFSEQQYDSTNAPNQRMQSVGGYSSGTANWVMQFFFSGSQALFYFATIGLADSVTLGTGNLHNLLTLGFNHTGTTNDLELDVSLTLSNV
jgi:hypothetical protein